MAKRLETVRKNRLKAEIDMTCRINKMTRLLRHWLQGKTPELVEETQKCLNNE